MESRFISLYSINSLTLVDPVQTQKKGIPTKNVLSFWEFELVKPFLFPKIFPRKHRNSLNSHISFCLEMQRSGHFNIFYHPFTGQINKEGEELQVFDFFSLGRQPLKLQKPGWKKVPTTHRLELATLVMQTQWAWAALCDLGVSLLIATVHGTRHLNHICSHCRKCWGSPLKTRYGKSPHTGYPPLGTKNSSDRHCTTASDSKIHRPHTSRKSKKSNYPWRTVFCCYVPLISL